MSLIAIDDLSDPRIAIYREVRRTKDTRKIGRFVLEGEKLLDRLIAARRFPIESILSRPDRAEAWASRVDPEVPVYALDEMRISTLVGYRFHLGVLAAARHESWPPPMEWSQRAWARAGRVRLVVCPNTNDPENLGSIARIADSFGIDGLVAGPGCPDPLCRRVLRVSMGAVLRLPVWTAEDALNVVGQISAELGVLKIAAVASSGAHDIVNYDPPDSWALVLGNEAQGLSTDWLTLCDDTVTIAMRPGADSLNVAVAAGILLHRLSGA